MIIKQMKVRKDPDCHLSCRCGADSSPWPGPRAAGPLPAGDPGQRHDGSDGRTVRNHLRHRVADRRQRQPAALSPQWVWSLTSNMTSQVHRQVHTFDLSPQGVISSVFQSRPWFQWWWLSSKLWIWTLVWMLRWTTGSWMETDWEPSGSPLTQTLRRDWSL